MERINFIKEQLVTHFPEKLRLACPNLYQSYEEYTARFYKKGGVIEKFPEDVL